MSNQIFEEGPEAPVAGGGAQEKLEKQARQLAYDVKYKVKQTMNRGTKLDPAAVKKAYLSFLGRATGSPQVKALAKKKLLGEGYVDVDQLVQDTLVNALVSEFGGKQINEDEDKTFKVRVTDKQTGNTYVRMATRAKIAELRANTNIASVEMTGYGEPTKSSAQATGSKPKAKKDFDGDGKKESSSKEHAGVVHNAIQKKKGGKQDGQDTRTEEVTTEGHQRDPDQQKKDRTHSKQPDPSKAGFTGIGNMSIADIKKMNDRMKKEEFIADAKKEDNGDKKVEELKKGKTNVVKVMPTMGEDAKYGYDKDGKSLNPKDKKEEEEDYRGMKTKVNLVRNKLRAMGLKMSQETEGELTEETPAERIDRVSKANVAKQKAAADAKASERAKSTAEFQAHKKSEISKGKRPDQALDSWQKKKLNAGDPLDDKLNKIISIIKENPQQQQQQQGDKQLDAKAKKIAQQKVLVLRKKAQLAAQGAQDISTSYEPEGELTEEFITESVDFATEYFYKQGLNEEGVDLVIEDVGIEEFTEFVFDLQEDLNEDRPAERDPKPQSYDKVKARIDKADAKRKAGGTREYAKGASGGDPAPRKKAAKKPSKVKVVNVKKPTPDKKVETQKKVVKSVSKAKTTQPKKPASKTGIRGAIERGIERHKAATKKASSQVKKVVKTAKATAKQHSQHRKDFVKGISPTAKEKKIAKGVGSAVKKSLTREEVLKEEEYDRQKDKHLERGGIGAVASHSDRKPNYGKPQTAAQKKKSQENSKKAFNSVVASLKKKYGDNAVMTKKEEVENDIPNLRARAEETECCSKCGSYKHVTSKHKEEIGRAHV